MSANMEQGGGECYYKIVAVKVATSCTVTNVIFVFCFFLHTKTVLTVFSYNSILRKGCFEWIVIANNLQSNNKSIRTTNVIIKK